MTTAYGTGLTSAYDRLFSQIMGGLPSFDEIKAVMEPSIDTVQEDMPILAHRAARLVGERGGVKLAAINRKKNDRHITFGIDEDASCDCTIYTGIGYSMPVNHNPVPPLRGDCGWYAVPADVDAWHDDCATVDLLVELSGRVVEHEKGYRAEHQRVVEVRVPNCSFCGGTPDLAVFDETAILVRFTCVTCKPIGGEVSLVPVSAIEKHLGVRLTPEVAKHA